jgi:aminoglycoside/choline kinase family phosphotransferase
MVESPATRDPEPLPGLRELLGRAGLDDARVEPLAGDVSARRYFRVRPARGPTRVLAHYPPELADAQRRFAAAAELLEAAGVRVPARLAADPGRGLDLLEDLGEKTLYERVDLGWDGRAPFVERALESARAIAGLPPDAVAALGSPPLDAALLRRELEQTIAVYLEPRELAPAPFVAALERLCDRLGGGVRVPCHRDLMARNLMPLPDGGVAVLDFQDLRLGPPAYDLASMLNDSLFAPAELERRWVERFLADGCVEDDYRRAVAQRALKAVGTFARFAERGDPRHLALVAPTLARAGRALEALPETAAAFAPLADRFARLAA